MVRRKLRSSRTCALGLVLIAAVAGCGSTHSTNNDDSATPSTKVTVDVGSGQVPVSGKPKRLAVFVAGSRQYTYTQALISGATDAADAVGLAHDVFQANFDPATQFAQVQSALSSGKYDMFALQPVDASLCSLINKQAVLAKVLVGVMATTLCGQDAKSGEALWSPGTVDMVLTGGNAANFQTLFGRIVKDNPGPQEALYLEGPESNGTTKAFESGVEAPKGWKVTRIYTDFSTPDAYAKVQNALQANPGVTLIYSSYVDDTVGALNAAQALGRNNIRFYDFGGSMVSKNLVLSGKVKATAPFLPLSTGKFTVESLLRAREGDKVDRVSGPANYAPNVPAVIDPTVAKSFKPEW